MLSFMVSAAICLALGVIVGGLGWGVSEAMEISREKGSPFECGFDPKGSGRISFSLQFFLIAVVFLVFDVEITLLLPVPFSTEDGWGLGVFSFFCFILILGLFHEWAQGALEWRG